MANFKSMVVCVTTVWHARHVAAKEGLFTTVQLGVRFEVVLVLDILGKQGLSLVGQVMWKWLEVHFN